MSGEGAVCTVANAVDDGSYHFANPRPGAPSVLYTSRTQEKLIDIRGVKQMANRTPCRMNHYEKTRNICKDMAFLRRLLNRVTVSVYLNCAHHFAYDHRSAYRVCSYSISFTFLDTRV